MFVEFDYKPVEWTDENEIKDDVKTVDRKSNKPSVRFASGK